MGRRIRVASVLPSATEALCFIGGEHLLVGRSHEDNFPESITHLPVLTGQKTTFTTAKDVDAQVSASLATGQSLYTIDEPLLRSLAPDVILTQNICSVCAIDLPTVERIAASMNPRPRVVSLNPESLDEVLENLLQLGRACGLEAEARAVYADLLARIARVDAAVTAAVQESTKLSVAFIEWPDPIYVGGHWTPQIIVRAGGRHPLNEPPPNRTSGAGKSFAVPSDAVVASAPELVILCPCGLDLTATQREVENLQQTSWWPMLPAVQNHRVALVNGDAMFNRPGPRLVDALEWMAATILSRPDLVPRDFPVLWLSDLEVKAAGDPKKHKKTKTTPCCEIEELHCCAVERGELTYIDPNTGYTVFTQLASFERGYCCGNGCRHCPYGHKNVPPERKSKLAPPIVVNV